MDTGIKSNIWYCIINPTAGKTDYKGTVQKLKTLFEANNIPYKFYITKNKGDATDITIKKIKDGYRQFTAIGGDGTVHEVVNGFMKQEFLPNENLLLAVIPIGTGNDWAKHHNIPSNIEKAFNLIRDKKYKYQDIGVAYYYNNKTQKIQYFNNVAGLAYDAFVVKKLEQRKSKPNKFIYIFSVLSYLLQYKLQKAKLLIDNQKVEGKFYTINIGICKYSGGGMSLVPHAIHDDGLFAITYAKEISKFDIIKNTYRFYNETLNDHPKIIGLDAKTISIDSDDNDHIDLELDGELVGHTPVEIKIKNKALKFISID